MTKIEKRGAMLTVHTFGLKVAGMLTNVTKIHTDDMAHAPVPHHKNKALGRMWMPTINSGFANRVNQVEKSKSPALNVGYNSHKSSNKRFFTTSIGVTFDVGTMTPKN